VSGMTRIKICGITNLEDAKYAVSLGVDSLGFIFADSPRQVNVTQVRRIVRELPPFVNYTGVFVNEDSKKVLKIAKDCSLDTLQLHGEEDPEYCRQFKHMKVIKAFRVKEELDLVKLKRYEVDAYLLDTYIAGQLGGTGETFNWQLAEQAKELGPIILAGGLEPANITEAINQVHPYGVDVSSGVEKVAGIKDHNKLKGLIKRIRRKNYD